jgi:hypothetical protein
MGLELKTARHSFLHFELKVIGSLKDFTPIQFCSSNEIFIFTFPAGKCRKRHLGH